MSSKSRKTKDDSSVIAIRTLCDLCKVVDTFHISTKDLLPHVGGLYQVSTIHKCLDEKEMVMTIILDRNYSVRQTAVSPFVKEFDDEEEDKWSAEKVADIKFLANQIRDSDKIIHSVLSSKQVVVVSTNAVFVKRIIHTLELFSPTKFPLVIDWTESVEKDKKIIGTKTDLAKNYKNAVIVDLDANKVLNGKSSTYSRRLLNNLITLELKGIAQVTKLKIDMMIQFSKTLIDLSKEPAIGSKAVDLIKMDVSNEALELIYDIVAGFDPTALEVIKQNWL